jgi:hypothetical protein
LATTSQELQSANTGAVAGDVISAVTGGTTDQKVAGSIDTLAAATAAIPIVNIFTSLAATVANLFSSAHLAKIKTEQSTISSAIPPFIANCQAIMAAASLGELDPTDAESLLLAQQDQYYAAVKSIIKKSGTCKPGSTGWGTPSGQCDKYGCPVTKDPCNASCCVGCYLVEPTVAALTAMLQTGGGSWRIPAVHSGDSETYATPTPTITYTEPNILEKFDNTLVGIFDSGAAQSLTRSKYGAVLALAGTIFVVTVLYVLWGRNR